MKRMPIRMMSETEAFFQIYDTTMVPSCAAVIGKTVLFFGGINLFNQISQLTPLGLIRIGSLPFFFRKGTCIVMGSRIYLGFGDSYDLDDYKSCWSR